MPTPANRTPVRVARGTYSNLSSSLSDIQEGEICYATDQDKLYVKEGSSLNNSQVSASTANTFTAEQTFNTTISQDGPYEQTAEALGSSFAVDCSLGNYFTKTIGGTGTFSFTNVPTSGQAYSVVLELDYVSGTVGFPSPATNWASGTAPTWVANKHYLMLFITSNGGTTWRAIWKQFDN